MSHEIVLYNSSKGKGKGIDDPQMRKFTRRTVDYGSDVVRWLQDCMEKKVPSHRLQSHYSFTKELVPPFVTPGSPYDSICPRFVHAAVNKNRSPVHVCTWYPNGRRLLTGSLAGEMTIWNGQAFHSENVMQAHNGGIKAMKWTPDESVMVSGDQLGVIKLWDQYIYNFQTFQAHKESICDIAIAPTGLKFCSCADDSHAKVWDLRTGEEERAFTGHGWDVKCCSWHPTKGLVATGSKDSQIKLWDPRASEAITTIFCHKNTVSRVVWSPNGQWLASASRDNMVMLMDIRTMSVRKVFKAHTKEVTSLCWHPETDELLASGGYEGAIHFWGTHGDSKPIESLPMAHEGPVWDLAWHPMGHLLVSGSNDYSTRFWSRARPGDKNFADLLPKRVALGANDDLIPPPPPAGAGVEVMKSGIFSELPGLAPPPEVKAILFATLALAPPPPQAALTEGETGSNQAVEPFVPMIGLSLGEGPSAKGILDTSDFDAEDDKPPSFATPAAKVQAKPPGLQPPAESLQADVVEVGKPLVVDVVEVEAKPPSGSPLLELESYRGGGPDVSAAKSEPSAAPSEAAPAQSSGASPTAEEAAEAAEAEAAAAEAKAAVAKAAAAVKAAAPPAAAPTEPAAAESATPGAATDAAEQAVPAPSDGAGDVAEGDQESKKRPAPEEAESSEKTEDAAESAKRPKTDGSDAPAGSE